MSYDLDGLATASVVSMFETLKCTVHQSFIKNKWNWPYRVCCVHERLATASPVALCEAEVYCDQAFIKNNSNWPYRVVFLKGWSVLWPKFNRKTIWTDLIDFFVFPKGWSVLWPKLYRKQLELTLSSLLSSRRAEVYCDQTFMENKLNWPHLSVVFLKGRRLLPHLPWGRG